MTVEAMHSTRLRLGLIGAGTFVHDAHLPALLAPDSPFEIVAVFSRTRATAEALAARIPYQVAIYDHVDTLLARPDIEAVDIAVPILAMPPIIEKALAARKHVLSEKPMAPTVADGRHLLTVYAQYPELVWMIAENVRYEPAYVQAARIIKNGEIGQPMSCHMMVQLALRPGNKYYHTPWRREGTVPGGFILDVGVHHIAALRDIIGEIQAVSATVRQMRPDLPPADTMSAVLEFAGGIIGSYQAIYGANESYPYAIHVCGERGTLRVSAADIEIRVGDTQRHLAFRPAAREDIHGEFRAFADAIRHGQPHLNTPQRCLGDVAVIEAILRSAATGQRVIVDTVTDS